MTQIPATHVRAATFVTALGLAAALAGTAVAGSSGPTATDAASAKKTAKKALKKATQNAALLAELCGSGASAAGSATCTAPQGPKGDPGTNGTNGTNGADGTARAYGQVSAAGAVSNSKNIAAVTKPSTGTYCITPSASAGIAASTPLVASPDFFSDTTNQSAEKMAHVEWATGAFQCGSGEFEVVTHELDVSGTTDDLTLADEPFSFVIP